MAYGHHHHHHDTGGVQNGTQSATINSAGSDSDGDGSSSAGGINVKA